MTSCSWRLALFSAAIWFVASVAFAQSTGQISGRLMDETGGVLPGVTVDLRVDGAPIATTTTDGVGAYRFENVTTGQAELMFQLINFSAVRRNVIVTGGATVTADAVLTLSLTADVVVTATRTFRNIADLENPAEDMVGIAEAASQGAITARQLEARPIMRPAEILEAVPGLIASQHSGEGKANRYYLRGFNLDHGFGLRHDDRWYSGQPAVAGALPRLLGHEPADPRAGERHPIQEGTVLRGGRRLLGRRIGERELRECARSLDGDASVSVGRDGAACSRRHRHG